MNLNIEDAKLKDVLLRESYVSSEDMGRAEDFAKTNKLSIVDYFLKNNLLSTDILGQAIAEAFNIGFVNLSSQQPTREQIIRIPQELGKKYRLVLYFEDEASVKVATDNPAQAELNSELQNLFPNKKIILSYAFPDHIDNSFIHYRDPLVARLTNIVKNQASAAPQVLEEILKEAVTIKASDIHFEPQEKDVVIRFRIDGVLHDIGIIYKELYQNILNRVKITAHIRIDEHNSPQDGAARLQIEGANIDLRISVVPTLDGEKIAIRILSAYIKDLTLSDLGLSFINQKVLIEASRRPFGMILVTGPTGSGKTTTLYALIKLLNRPEVNITTIEDPVEYKIPRINQIQVNTQTDLTFTSGLRSIVRQDPNIILVGEIRDVETSEIAVNAALTGHLLLSTFHANDAATSIPRLLDMGVEPFLMASTLELVIAQRLVRKICNVCKYSQSYTKQYLLSVLPHISDYFIEDSVTLYRGKGCNGCRGTGYQGRIGIFEFITIGSKMEDLILTNPSTKQIWDLAKSEGAKSLFEDGMEKVKNGVTTLDELLRVAAP